MNELKMEMKEENIGNTSKMNYNLPQVGIYGHQASQYLTEFALSA